MKARRIRHSSPIVCSLLLVLVCGCKAQSKAPIGEWALQGKPRPWESKAEIWEFKADGSFQKGSDINGVDVKEDGTYSLSGNSLTLNNSGVQKATAQKPSDPNESIGADAINSNPTPPKATTTTWVIDWKSDNEFTITTTNSSGESVTRTFDKVR